MVPSYTATVVPFCSAIDTGNGGLRNPFPCNKNEERKRPCVRWLEPKVRKTVWQVFEEERPFLMAYRGPFDGFHATEVAVSKTCLVRFDNNHYSVAVRAYADRIVIRQDGETVAEHPRSLGRGEIAYDSWHYVPILTRKPGALRNGAPFKGWQLPGALGRIRARLTGCDVGSRFPTTIPKAGGLLDLL